jgi:hypothetical protein
MDPRRFDAAARFFANRRLSRRRALAEVGTGLAAGALAFGLTRTAHARDAAPAALDAKRGPTMLFLQSFQSGSIAAKPGVEGRFTVTLEHGLGQTIYFSDRPDRVVGASPTDQFLAGLGFPADNPPNAALVVETAPGVTDIAVVELFAPLYDPAGPTVTYEVAVLADWEASSDLGFTAAPTDLAALAPSFGTAHLFIDDCPRNNVGCYFRGSGDPVGYLAAGETDEMCFNPHINFCVPCQPWFDNRWDLSDYWTNLCDEHFSACNEQCQPGWQCSEDTDCAW